ncbi:MAG TPA: hypothetical protein VED01_04110 [Burkholderiales bacterium]|nr:hypothetical protein [Burkholderiales bacterium]
MRFFAACGLLAVVLGVPAAYAQKFVYRDAEYDHEVELKPDRLIIHERSISGVRGNLSCPLGRGVEVHGGDGRNIVCVAFEKDRCSYTRVLGGARLHEEEWAKAQAAGSRTLQMCVEMAVEDANRIAALANLRARSVIPLVDPPEPVASPVPRKPEFAAGYRYEGEHRDGVPHGRGVMIWPNGERYDGQWVNGERHGRGAMVSASGYRYTGEWRQDKITGRGEMISPNGDRYEGDFVDGARHGRGRMQFKAGTVYDGDWRNDQMTGRGVMTWPHGDRYEGNVVNGVLSGFGEMRYADGGRYRGNWRDGQHDGEGVMVWGNGQQYSGQWRNGSRHGRGTHTYSALQRYEGEWRNDQRVQ